MLQEEIRERLSRLETSCLCDAKKTLRVLDSGIQPLCHGVKLIGRAFTVSCCDDFLTVIKALREASPGDVLVVDGQQGRKALAGELFSLQMLNIDEHLSLVATGKESKLTFLIEYE